MMSQLSSHGVFNIDKSNTSLFVNDTTPKHPQGITDQRHGTIPAAVFLLLLIAVLGLAGNFLVLKAFCNLKQRRLHEYLILNLVVTDCGTCLISIPFDVAEKMLGYFPFGPTLCHAIYPFQSVLVYVSVMTLLLMSGERFRLIVTPMKQRIGLKPGLIAIFGTWVLSSFIVLPLSLALRYENSQCAEHWKNVFSVKAFTLTIFLFLYIIPLIIMNISYACMLRVFYKDSKSIHLRKNIGLSRAMAEVRTRRNLRITRVFVAAVVAFAVCMLPTHITWLWHDFGNGSKSSHFGNVATFSNIAMYANSVLNPFIFGSLNVQSLTKLCTTLIQGRSDRGGEEVGQMFALRVRSAIHRPSITLLAQNSTLRVLPSFFSETEQGNFERETIV